jgi:hypothetical protein
MVTKKREDTAEGCRTLAQDDRMRAASASNDHARHALERSAEVWSARANLLKRLEADFNARAGSCASEREQRHRGRQANG